jgi:hypothetical protein
MINNLLGLQVPSCHRPLLIVLRSDLLVEAVKVSDAGLSAV